MSGIIYLTDVALITCIVDAGLADDVLIAARSAGARGAIVTSGRGWGARERLGALGVAVETEKDIVTILVSSELKDVMFDVVYRAADLDVPGRGLAFIAPLDKAATYVPEAVRERLALDDGDAS
jgi:nitrogen regulatory protein PII